MTWVLAHIIKLTIISGVDYGGDFGALEAINGY